MRSTPSMASGWPDVPLGIVPSGAGAGRLAEIVRRSVLGDSHWAAPLLDIDAVSRRAGLTVQEGALGAAHGGRQGLLIPVAGDRFSVTVDSEPPGGWGSVPDHLTEQLRRHRFRFRLAHEIGHTFFYWRGRAVPQRHLLDSPAQERFCDAFARALLVPDAATKGMPVEPQSILTLHERYDVSIELAARAFAAAHPQADVQVVYRPAHGPDRVQWSNTSFTHGGRARRTRSEMLYLQRRSQLLYCGAA